MDATEKIGTRASAAPRPRALDEGRTRSRAFRCWGCGEKMLGPWTARICAGCRADPPGWMQVSAAEAGALGAA